MKVLIYRDDGLGDSLFTIPSLKALLLSKSLSNDIQIFFSSNHNNLIKLFIKDINFIFLDEVDRLSFDVALFLGPWGRIKSFKHLKRIIYTKSESKFISSYDSKLVFKFLKLMLRKGYFFVNFDDIFVSHDIVNTFSFIRKSLEHFEEFLNLSNFSYDDIMGLYNYTNYDFQMDSYRDLFVIHFTYKSLRLGIDLKDYLYLVDLLSNFGKILVVFGPYEREFIKFLPSNINKLLIEDIVDYVKLCFSCKLMLCFDSGPGHLASFLNVPYVISIFPDDGFEYRIKRWKPYSVKSNVFVFSYSMVKSRSIGENLWVS